MFWRAQVGVWLVYATMLMIPWIGRYTIVSMIPNKLFIAGTGIVASTLLAAANDLFVARRMSRGFRATSLLGACVAIGALWNAVISTALGGTGLHRLPSLGVVEGGVPQLSGGLYHAFILLAWTAVYLAFRGDAAAPVATTPIENRIALRDNKRVVMLDPREIVWISADGDYVRVQIGREQLLLRETMIRAERALPAEFIRIHRSTIVNATRVRETIAQANRELVVVMNDGTRHRASRTYAGRLRTALLESPRVGLSRKS